MALTSMRLPDDLLDELGDLAEATGRTKTFLTIQALRNFIDQESWQIAEIKKGIAEADAGDFATEEELDALKAKWSRNAN